MVGKKNWKDYFKELVWSRFWNLATLWNFHWIRRRWYQFDQIRQIKQSFSAEVIGGISTKSLMSRYIHNYGNRSSTTGNSGLSTLSHFWFKYPNIWFVTIIRLRKYQLCFFFEEVPPILEKQKMKIKLASLSHRNKGQMKCAERRSSIDEFILSSRPWEHQQFTNMIICLQEGEGMRVMFLVTKRQ